jgi:hypothetical protein
MISRTTTLALVAMAAQSAAQAAWDGSTKPRMESSGGDLHLHTHDDVNINFRGRAEGRGITASLYDLVTGQGTLTSDLDDLEDDIADIRRELPVTCQLSEWGAWGECSAACGGVERRTRTVTRQANNYSVPCSEYRTTDDRACGPVCGATDVCGDNEKWYFLNSGRDRASVISYTNQSVYLYRTHSYPGGGSSWNGGGGTGRFVPLRAGVTTQINPADWGLIKFYNGDYMCGSTGAIEIVGNYGDYDKEWAPARVAGTQFVFPAPRSNPQYIIVHALEQSVVSLYYGTTFNKGYTVQAGDRFKIQASRSNRNYKFNSTGNVIVTYVAGQASSDLSSHQVGNTDYMIMVPAARVMYGIPSSGYVAAWTTGQARVTVACRGRANRTITVRGNQNVGNLGSTGGHYTGNPCLVTAATPAGALIGAVSAGDGDGSDGTAWHPRSMFSTRWLGPVSVQHLAFVCSGAGVITVKKSMTAGPTQRITIQFQNGVGKAYTTNQAILRFAGWYASSTVPCMLTVDSARSGREMTSFGTTQTA